MIHHSSRRVNNEEDDAKGMIFLYHIHRLPSTKVNLALGTNENNS